jgi:hypothetical protein
LEGATFCSDHDTIRSGKTIAIASVGMTCRVAKLADQAHTFIFERLAELKN